MNAAPTSLSLPSPDLLRIVWSDGVIREYPVRELRDACPCASCREKRGQPAAPVNPFAVISKQEAQPTRIAQMHPVGSYAYSIHFSDGHNTGLFTLEFLRELGREAKAE